MDGGVVGGFGLGMGVEEVGRFEGRSLGRGREMGGWSLENESQETVAEARKRKRRRRRRIRGFGLGFFWEKEKAIPFSSVSTFKRISRFLPTLRRKEGNE